MSEVLELLACERKMLEFLHKDSEHHLDDVKPITMHNLFEFWKRVQIQKEKLKDLLADEEND